jgi:hypothetical protein
MAQVIEHSAKIIGAGTPQPRETIMVQLAGGLPRTGSGGNGSSPSHSSALSDFVRHSQPWSRVRMALPRRLRLTLWALIPIQLLWGIWLVTIVTGDGCDGRICSVATLDGHAAVLLVLAVLCLAGLLGLVPTTRGLSQCNGAEAAGLGVAAVAGGAALLGIAALLLGAVIVLMIFAAFFTAFD